MEKIIIHKDKSHQKVSVTTCFFVILCTLLIPFFDSWRSGIETISTSWFLSVSLPVVLISMIFLYLEYQELKKKIVIGDDGVLFEEFNNTLFLWEEIKGVSTRTINAERVLVIHTTDDQKYLKRKITKLEKWLGYTGVNVGSLSCYKVYPDEIRDIILSGVRN